MKAATLLMIYTGMMPGISIHAAREGGDANAVERLQRARISIHAAREGGDAIDDAVVYPPRHFNPRRP